MFALLSTFASPSFTLNPTISMFSCYVFLCPQVWLMEDDRHIMAVLSCQDGAQQEGVAAGRVGDSEVVLTSTALKGGMTPVVVSLCFSFSYLTFLSWCDCRRRSRRMRRHLSPFLGLSGYHHHGASR
ncbi:hypothetical protein AMECASPLE_036333 [Ameca splendens]|uniref:Uncharacterized protein n=1 Tax=Ameca splendens TaxID=208324 RepID=A0ABV0ZHI6_9TELE